MKKIAAIEKNDRPREKLKLKGARALSDFELLQAARSYYCHER